MAAKPDWALLKAGQIYPDFSLGHAIVQTLAKLLRAERRRAVRACRKRPMINESIAGTYDDGYVQACDDCAKAIQGGKL